MNEACSDFIEKFTFFIDKIAPCKTERVKCNYKEWFDSVVSSQINNKYKLFKKLKTSRLPLNEENYNNVTHEVKKLIAKKERNDFETKLTENNGKP